MTSPSVPAGPSSPVGRKVSQPSHRRKLRNGTFILPGTGERVHRQITLRNPANFEPPGRNSMDSNDPLLPHGEYDDEDKGVVTRSFHHVKEHLREQWEWLQTPTGRGVLKCSFAYLLGSMGTYLPFLARFLGKQDGKHMVATITVYFNPARSAGSMVEAVMLGVAAFLYATFISTSSMAVSVLCESQFDLIELGYVLVLVVFCGGGLGLVGWAKQRLGTPLVSVACSLASLAIITVLTKENAIQTAVFSDDKIVQVMKMVVLGVAATTAVCLLIWPVSARRELRESMIKTTDALADMLTTVTQSFLTGSESDLKSTAFKDVNTRYRSGFSQLVKNLGEAKLEHYVLGTEDEYKLEASLVNCMQRLSQAIGGLRSAATTQFALLKERSEDGFPTPMNSSRLLTPQIHGSVLSPIMKNKQDRFGVLTAIDEDPAENMENDDSQYFGLAMNQSSNSTQNDNGIPSVRSPGEIFGRFIMHLGPSMKSIAYTLSQILEELPFGEGPEYKIAINDNFRTSLTEALQLYSNARTEALSEIYKSKDLRKDRPQNIEADLEEVAASCGHFSYNLQEFGVEMQTYLEILEDLKIETEKPNRRSWKWILFWRSRDSPAKAPSHEEEENLAGQGRETGLPRAQSDLTIMRGKNEWKEAEKATVKNRFHQRILTVVRFVRRDDIRFAIKVGVGAALWAMIAFIPETRPFYSHWRGEWGLLSYMLVCSMTIGASNTTGYSRFVGTLMGAVLAVVVWLMCCGNPFALAFVSWLVSIPCFYIIVAKGQGPMGRFILLTYNLSVLYAYSLSIKEVDDDEDEGGKNPIITEIVIHRVVAVMFGVLWGMFITRVIWPISAGRKFKDELSLLWLRMGLIWKRDPLSALLEGSSTNAYMDLQEEMSLQRYLSRLDKLRVSATHEFELKGPFPNASYGCIMESTDKMLDAFHAMNVVIRKDPYANEGESALLRYTAEERSQLCARISHLFQVIASSMKLEYPLSDALPRSTNARDRLLARVFHFRKEEAASEPESSTQSDSGVDENGEHEALQDSTKKIVGKTKDEDYALLYAFALVTGQLAEEIEKVEKEIESLFGVLDEDALMLR